MLAEVSAVASYDWMNSWEVARRHAERQPDAADHRSPFEHDRSRIIHSGAFRRLQGKTQIFGPGWADYMRTRVTHAMEVAQIGRALGENAGIPGSLLEAACLAHDLGHPPFGHTGERMLNELMKEHGGFEGNAQTFRILERLEEKHPSFPGLNLCRTALLGTIKYPYRRTPAVTKKYLYDEDVQACEAWLFEGTGLGLLSEKSAQEPRTIVCQLMDWADDIAYSVHDLEDGLASGFLIPARFLEEAFLEIVHTSIGQANIRWKDGPPNRSDVKAIVEELQGRVRSDDGRISQSRIREATRHYINRFVTCVTIKATSDPVKSSFDFERQIPEEVFLENQVLKAIVWEFVIRDERTTTFAFKGGYVVRTVFEALLENTTRKAGRLRFELFPRSVRDELRSASNNASATARIVCDFVAKMTDGQVMRLHRRMFEADSGSPLEPI